MIKWFIDKNNKMPLYLQLKDLIKYYISTGSIQADQQLPGVNALAKELGVNFETVRKAYKELERDGLLSVERGRGTHVILSNVSPAPMKTTASFEDGLLTATKNILKNYLRQGRSLEEAQGIIDQAFQEVSADTSKQQVVFTECNTLQIKEISQLLKSYLGQPVKPVLIKDLKDELQNISHESGQPSNIVTTGFHVDEVRETVRNLPVNIHVLITHMSMETRRKLSAFGKNARFGFICRDQESISLYKDVLKVELDNPKLNLICATSSEESKVEKMLKSLDVLLISPPAYEEIKRIAPPELPIFNVFDQVDAMALRIVKDSILASNGQEARQAASLS